MMMKSVLSALFFLFAISACTPSYTVDSIDSLSKKVGVVDYFEISRWHHYLMAQDSRLAVSAKAESSTHATVLSKAIKASFAQYYADVTVFQVGASQPSLISQARAQGYDFLLRAELLSAKPAPHPDEEGQSYKHLKILISVIDVNSEQMVDKILLSSNKSRIPFVRGQLDELLREPLSATAKELSGVE